VHGGDEAIVPAYHHGSEVETLHRAGFTCRFYDCDAHLRPRADEVDALVSGRTRLFYLIHHFGIPQDAPRWRRWCDDRGLLLVEDAAQAWLSSLGDQPTGTWGDLAIYCLHKSFGLPDGGALMAKVPVPPTPAARRTGLDQALRRTREWAGQRWHWMAAREPELRLDEDVDRSFALGDADSPPSTLTTFLLRRIAASSAAATRRQNFRILRTALGEVATTPMRDTDGCAPYAFVTPVESKRSVLEELTRAGVVGGALWNTPHPSLAVAQYPTARQLRSTLIGLPVHQELRARDLGRIAAAFERTIETRVAPVSQR
jgi:dTDP-4-amino-4,6-dideoxygalactose transaminase